MNQQPSFKTALADSMTAALGHAMPLLARLRDVLAPRLGAKESPGSSEPKREEKSLVLQIAGMTCGG